MVECAAAASANVCVVYYCGTLEISDGTAFLFLRYILLRVQTDITLELLKEHH